MRRIYNNIIFFFILLTSTFSFSILPSCKSSKSEVQSDVQQQSSDFLLLEIYPKDRTSVLPNDFEIYVVTKSQIELENIRFLVWKEGQQITGRIREEKVSNLHKIIYEPTTKDEGTYLVYFAYGERATFWTFFAETTKTIPIFDKISIPRDNFKGFPYGTPIIITEERLLNFTTIDDETVSVKKKFLFEESPAAYDISFLPNSIIVNLLEYESSMNYKVEVTGILFLEENPNFTNTIVNFRSIDTDKPFIKTCSPNFCTLGGSCSSISPSIKNFEITFGDNEEIDPLSVVENLVIELNGSRVNFGEVWSVSESRSLIHKNPSGNSKVYIFPNKIFFDFGVEITNSKISIYILPKLSDSSGNSIDQFFSWCIDVQ